MTDNRKLLVPTVGELRMAMDRRKEFHLRDVGGTTSEAAQEGANSRAWRAVLTDPRRETHALLTCFAGMRFANSLRSNDRFLAKEGT